MFNKKKVIIFDMDGTLIDSVGIWNLVDTELIRQLNNGFVTMSENEIQMQRDSVLRKFAEAESPYLEYCLFLKQKFHSQLSPDSIHALRYDIAQNYLENYIDYKNKADVFVRELKEHGCKLCIASTTRKKNMDIYRLKNKNIRDKANIDDYFCTVYTREDVNAIKPDPEVYELVVESMNVKKEECLVIEDSLVGIEAAIRAGLDVVALYDKYSNSDWDKITQLATYSAKSYDDLLVELCC